MKLTFFLLAIGLILVRLCYPHLEIWYNQHGHGTMITRNDHYIEEIDWSGKVRFSDDERSVAEISPGGYLKFRENDTTLKAESDLQGEITYRLYNGVEQLPLNDSGRQFIAAQVLKMIRFGFLADQRAERIYKNAGVGGILAELSKMGMHGDVEPYFKRLFRVDTLTVPERLRILQLLDSSDNRDQGQDFLGLFNRDQLRDSAVAREWLTAVGHLDASYMKKDLLSKYIDTGLTADPFDTVLAITTRFDNESDEEEVYKKMITLPKLRMRDPAFALPWLAAVGRLEPSYMKKDLLMAYLDTAKGALKELPAGQFDTVVAITGRLESPDDQKDIYVRLIGMPPVTDAEWTGLVRATGALGDRDDLKSDLLLKIAPKMPRTDSVISVYKMSAKSIRDDTEFGKVMRAID